MSKKKFGALLAGLTLGAGLGVLFAPKKGTETRKELKIKLDEMLETLKNVEMSDVKKNVENKIYDIKQELEDLNKEKVLKIAKEKAKLLQKKSEELFNYTVKKGTPILEKAADDVRSKAIDVTKEVLNKLEKKN